jgi:cyclic di-GMP phosphodiesterase
VRSEESDETSGVDISRILIVDDEEDNVHLLESILDRAGFRNYKSTTDSERVLHLYRDYRPDLILLDLRMPNLDGFAILEQLKAEIPTGEYLPIIVMTADVDEEAKRRALSLGAKAFMTKPFDHIEAVLRVRNVLESRHFHVALRAQNDLLEVRVLERTKGLWEAVQRLTESEAATREAVEETIQRLAMAAELRDEETGWHIERMSRYAALIANRIGLDNFRCETLRLASSMHDVGKIGVPDRILLKRGKLTAKEFVVIKLHPEVGHRLLAESSATVLQDAATIALTHHERFDGAGYPAGLAGDEIPLEGRIAAVADVFDALTSTRIYRKAFPLGQALEMMRKERGAHFDPTLLDAFFPALDEALQIMQRYEDRRERPTRRRLDEIEK